MTTSSTAHPRQPKGQPTGGQFAAKSNPEADIELDWVPPDELFLLPDDEMVQEVDYATMADDPADGSGPPVEIAAARSAVAELQAELAASTGRRAELAAIAEVRVTAAGHLVASQIDAASQESGVPIQQATVAVLATYRPLGDAGRFDVTPSSHKPAVKAIRKVAEKFPQSWLHSPVAGQRPPLRLRVGTGRHYYRPARSIWVKAEPKMVNTAYDNYPVDLVPPNAKEVTYWTDSAGHERASWIVEHRVVPEVLTQVSEITVPSPSRFGEARTEQVATHELSHRLEDTNPHLGVLEKQFLERRCVDANGNKTPAVLRRGSRGERFREGGFVDSYIGKVYESNFAEVLSVGAEAVFTGSYGGLVGEDGHKADLDHRAFVLGLLATA